MTDTPRPVWISREQRDALVDDELGFYAVTHAIADAWDAAPADAVEATRNALIEIRAEQGQNWFESFWYGPEAVFANRAARALGMPE